MLVSDIAFRGAEPHGWQAVSGVWRSGEDMFRVTLVTTRVEAFVVVLVAVRAAVLAVALALAVMPPLGATASSWPRKTAS